MNCYKENYWQNPWADEEKRFKWTKEKEDYLVSEWLKETKVAEIAEHLGITSRSVQRHIAKHRERLGLAARRGGVQKKPENEFERLWHGPVPCKHWMITKRWSSSK